MTARSSAPDRVEAIGRPWPYRKDGEPLPTFCPKCGRHLLPYAWGTSTAYLELACAGRLQWFFRRWRQDDLFLVFQHYSFTVDAVAWSQYDPMTGERHKLPIAFR